MANSKTQLAEAGEQIVKKKPRGGNSPVIGDNGLDLKPGDGARAAKICLDVASWGDVDKHDVHAMEERLGKYLQYCIDNDVKVGNQMCYLALGITKDDVYDWENGRSGTTLHSDFIKKVRKICAGNREVLLQDGKVNAILGIFWQKNYDGLKDVQDFVLTPNQPLGSDTDAPAVAGKYQAALPESKEEV